MRHIRLGVNIDHVATVRNARGGDHPDPVRAALLAIAAGADSITAHLREDRRHIRDDDIYRLKDSISKPLNFEMAATDEMRTIALSVKPHAACIVPERRQEVTTEGGLNVIANERTLRPIVAELKGAGIRVSLFIDPELAQLDAAARIGAPVVELHTGAYAHASGVARRSDFRRLAEAAAQSTTLGLECHAGHGLTYENVGAVAALPEVVELNIGHFLVGEAIFEGFAKTIREMRKKIDAASAGDRKP